MTQAQVEPVSRRNRVFSVPVSLRGTLADHYTRLREEKRIAEAEVFVQALLSSADPDVMRFLDDEFVVIGRRSERGQFFPDW